MKRSAAQLWVQNEAWIDASGMIHGMLTRRGLPIEGKLPLGESIALAAPAIGELMMSAGNPAARMTVVSGDQVHADRIAIVRSIRDLQGMPKLSGAVGPLDAIYEFPETDGLVTNRRGVLLVIQTADCLPIMFVDRERGVLGACHCGWKGLMARLAQKTVHAMTELGARADSIGAWIGPCIRTANYEVSAEMVRDFAREFPSCAVSPDGRKLDLTAIAVDQLRAAGLAAEKIFDSRACTFADAEAFHSYRREGAKAGRLLTMIGFLGDSANLSAPGATNL
jgi:YfiH family protein